ncbi:MAG: asparagine synthase (glutamine-hydrolyzing) [Desulfobacteraceae bacterium]|nr:asparagine synthase (glutamine-hydrolyzing) [Desulfobacteraceae bacterium]
MCGIAGIVNYKEEPDKYIVAEMMHIMRHRGPDGEGIFVDQNSVLGHVRLSIIDVEGSKQPLSNEDETIWITFNGEIYNYKELREKLLAKGHQFRTQGDTETLVHLYEEYGADMVHHLQGMFAFAIWDKSNHKLLIARDRLGIKPLYYWERDGNFLFASEPKAILMHPSCQASPDPESIWHYMTYRSVPSPATLFKGMKKLRPGSLLVLNKNGLSEKCYWDITLVAEQDKAYCQKNCGRYVDETESLLLTSVKRRLISDVPLGAFLSGGIDSSLIVALMHKLTNAPVKTYSVGFKDFPTSELGYARSVAERFNTDHHELVLEEDYFAENLEKLTWMRDSPLSERSDVPLYLLAKMASKDVKVLLSGEGSDELFAGYPKYAYDRFAPAVNMLSKPVVHLVSELLPARFRRIEVALRSLCERNVADRWAQWFAPFTSQEKSLLFDAPISAENPMLQYVKNTNSCSLDMMLYADCKLWLPENLLERGDRMTMAASVEGRVPFLDHEFVDFAFAMSERLKIKKFKRKWLIKEVARRYLPNHIVDRRKVGFEVPLAQWFRGRLRDMCYDRICRRNGLATHILSRKELEKILDDHCSYRKDNFLKIWTLLGLAIWNDLFCSNDCKSASI